ncbi:CTR1-like protein [Mya arenaria]|uniref:CTR1-like protein n=1 Tax=Mya arenaria TaxID=6604 RepID=A0ABY7F3Q4_MYAAR|nr:CTR1-like protein [Mya arenaria]
MADNTRNIIDAAMLEVVVVMNQLIEKNSLLQTQNGDELIENQSDLSDIIVITCMLSLFSIIGTTGNAFVLYVFSKKKDKNTSTVFILALASIDFATCIVVIPFSIAVEFQFKKIGCDLTCKIYQFLITSNVPFSSFIMVAIAFDRYFCICRPWTKFLNTKCAIRIIFSLLAFALTL